MLMRRLAAALAMALLCAGAAACSTGPMATSAAQTSAPGDGAAPAAGQRTVEPIRLRLGG